MNASQVARTAASAVLSVAALAWGALSVTQAAPPAETVITAVPAPKPSRLPTPPRDLDGPRPPGSDSPLTPTALPTPITLDLGPSNQKPGAHNEDTTTLNRPQKVQKVVVDRVRVNRGKLLSMPVNGPITSSFGMRYHPVLHVTKLHTGTDFGVSCGTPIGASAPGKVTFAGWGGGYGIRVVVDHGTIGGHRVQTSYSHLQAPGVRVGDTVAAGDGVGLVGNTGYSTGCHLHYEVIANGQFTDPVPWLNGEPVIVNLDRLVTPSPRTPSPPPTPSLSETPSPGLSPTPSPTPSTSPSESETPSASGQPTPTPTACLTPTPTPGVPPTGTPEPCILPSQSPSGSPVDTPSARTPGPQPSGSPSERPSTDPSQPESTLSPSGIPTP